MEVTVTASPEDSPEPATSTTEAIAGFKTAADLRALSALDRRLTLRSHTVDKYQLFGRLPVPIRAAVEVDTDETLCCIEVEPATTGAELLAKVREDLEPLHNDLLLVHSPLATERLEQPVLSSDQLVFELLLPFVQVKVKGQGLWENVDDDSVS